MNYIGLLNAYEQWSGQNSLTVTAELLWYKLVGVWNRTMWKESFRIDNQRLMGLLRTNSEHTLIKARNMLIKAGLLEYEPGKRGLPGRYRMLTEELAVKEKCKRTIDEQKPEDISADEIKVQKKGREETPYKTSVQNKGEESGYTDKMYAKTPRNQDNTAENADIDKQDIIQNNEYKESNDIKRIRGVSLCNLFIYIKSHVAGSWRKRNSCRQEKGGKGYEKDIGRDIGCCDAFHNNAGLCSGERLCCRK